MKLTKLNAGIDGLTPEVDCVFVEAVVSFVVVDIVGCWAEGGGEGVASGGCWCGGCGGGGNIPKGGIFMKPGTEIK